MYSRVFFKSSNCVRNLTKYAIAIVLCVCSVSVAMAQDTTGKTYSKEDFINVDGSSLQEKLDRAERQFRDSRQGTSFWAAYHFQVRDGISVGPFSGYVYEDGDGIRLYRKDDPNTVAVFLLMDTSGSRATLSRIKTLNLSEPYLFESRPVYWLGNVDTGQSISYMQSVMHANSDNKDLIANALRAISIHNSPQVIPMLKEVALKDSSFDIQRSAIRALGRIPAKESLDALDDIFNTVDNTSLKQETIRSYAANGDHIAEKRVLDRLTTISKSDKENLDVRVEAIRRIASFRGDAIVDRLFDIYNSLNDRNVKIGIIQTLSGRGARDDQIMQRLATIAKKDQDSSLQVEAVRRISNVTNSDSPEATINTLIEIYDSNPGD